MGNTNCISAVHFVLYAKHCLQLFSDNPGQKCWEGSNTLEITPLPLINVGLKTRFFDKCFYCFRRNSKKWKHIWISMCFVQVIAKIRVKKRIYILFCSNLANYNVGCLRND